MSRNDLFKQPLNTVDVGTDSIHEDMKGQEIPSHQVDWIPPTNGDPEPLKLLGRLKNPALHEKIQQASGEAITRIIQSKPILVGFDRAISVISNMAETTILHTDPPIIYENMCGSMKGTVQGASAFERLAKGLADADRVARSDAITFSPYHEHDAVGSVAGMTSPNMYVHIIRNGAYGNMTFTNLNEQLAKVLRFGANDQSVVDRLTWTRDVLGPSLRDAMTFCPEDTGSCLMFLQALYVGDECHNHNVTGSTLLVQVSTLYMVQTDFSRGQLKEVFEFLGSPDYLSGPIWVGAAKCALNAGHNMENNTIATTMCRNGVEFGIRAGGIGGNHWFTGLVQRVVDPMFAGYTQENISLDMGDSVTTETYGVGGFAMAVAPTIVPLVGGAVAEVLNYSKEVLEAATKENPNVMIPILGFMGIPSGIDILKVLETEMLPATNTVIAHKEPETGTIGAGLTSPPTNVSNEILKALVAEVN